MKIALLTGGGDKPYALGLLDALISKDVSVDFIGNDEMGSAKIIEDRRVNFHNLRGNQSPTAPYLQKIVRVIVYYFRLIKYVTTTKTVLFHILWFNKLLLFDRTVLNLYYKLLHKKLVFTAHNVDEKERDGGNSFLNRLSLRVLYNLVDHIFVHTRKMKSQLVYDFNVPEHKVSVIPFGINNTIPTSSLSRDEARAKLDLDDDHKVVLFFGNIAPYKGLDDLVDAMARLVKKDDRFRLVIAGQVKGCQAYWARLENIISKLQLDRYIIKRIGYIPDEDVEGFFKSADVLVLPYKFIYQSGVLFLSYSFGLPVIATDVGSLREDIVEGMTGMICRAEDPDDLADTILRYFDSYLFREFDHNREGIVAYGNERYSWDEVGNTTCDVYEKMFLL
jgi:D-inositol-3-phosphate glycosyltransferase